MRKLLALAALLLPATTPAQPLLGYVTVGPMLHWNFSDNAFRSFSIAVEAAYWAYRQNRSDGFLYMAPDGNAGYGLDLGVEFDRRALRLYTEPQVGWVYAGLALGPVLERPWNGDPARLGIQGSGWANAVVGIDFRLRYVGGIFSQAPGLYGKLGTRVHGGVDSSP